MNDALIEMVEDDMLLCKASERDKKGKKYVSFTTLAKKAGISPDDIEGYESVEIE